MRAWVIKNKNGEYLQSLTRSGFVFGELNKARLLTKVEADAYIENFLFDCEAVQIEINEV